MVQNNSKECTKKRAVLAKLLFLLIRPIAIFHRSPALPSRLAGTARFYILFEQTRGGSKGGCRGCADLRFSYTAGILQKKNYVVYCCRSRARDECTPSLKKILDPPLQTINIIESYAFDPG